MAIIIIDERPYGCITIKAGNDVIKADQLDEKTLALAKKLDSAKKERPR